MSVVASILCLCRRSESVLTRIPMFACSGGWLVNMPLVAWHKSGWRVYTHLLLGVNSTMAKWFRTIGTANNERVHSFCSFLPNPFIEDQFFWRSSHGFVLPCEMESFLVMFCTTANATSSELSVCNWVIPPGWRQALWHGVVVTSIDVPFIILYECTFTVVLQIRMKSIPVPWIGRYNIMLIRSHNKL